MMSSTQQIHFKLYSHTQFLYKKSMHRETQGVAFHWKTRFIFLPQHFFPHLKSPTVSFSANLGLHVKAQIKSTPL